MSPRKMAGARDVVATSISLLMLTLLTGTSCSPDDSQQASGDKLMGSVAKMEEQLIVGLSSEDKLATDGQPRTAPRRRVSTKTPLNLVFTRDPRPNDQGGKLFGAEWIQLEVLSQINRPVRVHFFDVNKGWENHPWRNDTLVVYVYHGIKEEEAGVSTLFQKLHSAGLVNIGAYHMGDEFQCANCTKWYNNADYVIRNYWFKQYADMPNTQYAPLGTRGGLTSRTQALFLPASQRKFLCNFFGSLRADRSTMLDNLSYKRQNCNLMVSRYWADPQATHPYMLRQVLLDSTFTLAPFGNNEESMRFYEALEAGSIPIVMRSKRGDRGDFIDDGIGGNVPLPKVDSWTELDSVLKKYDEDPVALDKLQEDVLAWWAERRLAAFSRIGGFIEKSFQRFHGDDA